MYHVQQYYKWPKSIRYGGIHEDVEFTEEYQVELFVQVTSSPPARLFVRELAIFICSLHAPLCIKLTKRYAIQYSDCGMQLPGTCMSMHPTLHYASASGASLGRAQPCK